MDFNSIKLDQIDFSDLGQIQKRLIDNFGLDVQNSLYYMLLLHQLGSTKKPLPIVENIKEKGYLPLAIPGSQDKLKINITPYSDILSSNFSTSNSKLKIRPLLAGLGTSVKRGSHIETHGGRDQDSLGTKSTDLFIQTEGATYSIFDLLLLQLSHLSKTENRLIEFEPLVSPQTKDLIKGLVNNSEEFHSDFNFQEMKLQEFVPVYIETENQITNRFTAPAGHGFFGFKALLDIIESGSSSDIYVICNGEDINAVPPSITYDWFESIEEPICMITTRKTKVDKKGGQICVVSEDNETYVTILEKAQAESNGQLDLFYELGLREQDDQSLFNTNTVLIHSGRLLKILKEHGQSKVSEELLSSLKPDLIKNKKIKGSNQEVVQLEGAMGSVMLNLDRWFRKEFDQPMVAFLNVDPKNRSHFFSPIKTAFDFIHKFNSNRFLLENFRLKDKSPGLQVSINLQDPSGTIDYDDVETCLRYFSGCRLKDLESLQVTGPVDFSDTTLSGKVIINNPSSETFYLYGFGRTHGPTDPKNIKIDLSGDSNYIVEDI